MAGGDGDPELEETSLAHVVVDHQNAAMVVAAAAVVGEVVRILADEGKGEEDGRGAARVSTERR